MRVCVFSDSSQSIDLPEYDCLITTVHRYPGEVIPEADVYIWDYSSKIKLESEISARRSCRHLVLAEPSEVGKLASVRTWACILVKPLTPFILKAFLDAALKNWQVGPRSHLAEAARFERDAFLQYVLDVNLRLQQYDQERNNFLACAMHDLRTPLTAIHGYCGLLAEGKLGFLSTQQRELLERMQYSTRRLMRLTSGTLSLLTDGRSRTAGTYPQGDIGQALRRALHDVEPLIREKKISVRADVRPPSARMSFEPEQIQQVFINLLENSCKFVPRNGTIEICGYPYSGNTQPGRMGRPAESLPGETGYRIDMTDSGPGIAPELAERIFEPYASFSQHHGRSARGLGLAICKSIVLAHQGVIWATPSRAGGHFSFVLPVASARPNAKTAWAETSLELKEAAS